jgi:phospholipase C
MNQVPNESWLWTVVVVQGDREDLYNFQDPATGNQVTPAFQDKDAAQAFWTRLTARPSGEGVVQAIQRPNLEAAAKRHGLTVVLYGADGRPLA